MQAPLWRAQLLQVLRMGNFKNDCGTAGFALDARLQLHTTKGAGGVTALHCWVIGIARKDAQFCANLQKNLHSVLRAAQQQLQVLRERITRLREKVAFLCGSAWNMATATRPSIRRRTRQPGLRERFFSDAEAAAVAGAYAEAEAQKPPSQLGILARIGDPVGKHQGSDTQHKCRRRMRPRSVRPPKKAWRLPTHRAEPGLPCPA